MVEEPPAPGVEETFPHIYGPLNPAAVVAVTALSLTGCTRAPVERSAAGLAGAGGQPVQRRPQRVHGLAGPAVDIAAYDAASSASRLLSS